MRLSKKKEDLVNLKNLLLKEINTYITSQIDKIDEKVYDLQNNSTMTQL